MKHGLFVFVLVSDQPQIFERLSGSKELMVASLRFPFFKFFFNLAELNLLFEDVSDVLAVTLLFVLLSLIKDVGLLALQLLLAIIF